MRLLFSIQTHFINEYVGVLVRELAAEGDFVDLSIDMTELPRYAHRIATFPRTRVSLSRPVIWCGPSQMLAMLDSIRAALEVEGWDFLINLSADSMMLRGHDELRGRLRDRHQAGARALISHWGPLRRDFTALGETEPAALDEHQVVGRDPIRTTARLAELFGSFETTPVRWPEKRFALDCAESHAPKMLTVTPASPERFADRARFYGSSGLYVSRAFYALHRDLCRTIADKYAAGDPVIAMFAGSFQPDESFLPSFLFHAIDGFAAICAPNDIHYRGGARSSLDEEHAEAIRASGAFFARKLKTPGWRETYRLFGREAPVEPT